jgi:hypothetical protein
MVNTNKHLASSLIIFSSFDFHKSQLMESLSCGARQAYFLRDYARLKVIGEKLIDLSPRSEYIGRWYVILANRKLWKEHRGKLIPELESLAHNAPLSVRAAIMSSLAGIELLSGKANQGTVSLILEASKISLKCGDILNFIQLQTQCSEFFSIKGNHLESLEVLRGLQPTVQKLGGLFSVIKSDYYNNVAFELHQLGNHEAAKGFVSYVLKSPHLKLYPEWQQTAKDVFVQKPSRSIVAVKKSNVLYFPIRNHAVKMGEVIYRYNSRDYKLRDLCANRINELCNWLDVANSLQSQREGNLL